MTRFLLAVLIGVGLTLAWQSYGDQAKQIVGPWARDTLLPRWTAPQVDSAPKQPRSTPVGDITDAEVAKSSAALMQAALMQQLEAMARDLAMIRGDTEQLATKQQEVAQSIATLQANIEQKLGSPPVPPAAAALPPNENTSRRSPPADPAGFFETGLPRSTPARELGHQALEDATLDLASSADEHRNAAVLVLGAGILGQPSARSSLMLTKP
jgi:hypothetical protein